MADIYDTSSEIPAQYPLYNSNLPVGAMSPYLAIDPSIFRSAEPQYILPEGAAPRRGRFELAFSQIGLGVLSGFSFGSVYGLYKGYSDVTLRQLTWSVYRTQMLNYMVKHASSAARPLGVIMLFYSGFGVIISKLRGGADDEMNTVVSAASTGLLFRAVRGWQASLKGAGMGAALGVAWVIGNPSSRDNVKKMFHSITN